MIIFGTDRLKPRSIAWIAVHNEHPATPARGLNAPFILQGQAGLALGWLLGPEAAGFWATSKEAMSPEESRNTVILAALLLIASVGTAVAYQSAPVSTVGTFDFAYVGVALTWDAVFSDERLDEVAVTGIAPIVVAGVLAVRRPKNVS